MEALAVTILGNVLVTGGTGLLGSELVSQLIEHRESQKLVCLVRDEIPQSRFFTEGLKEQVIVVYGDIKDQQLISRVIADYDINTIFHLAAQTLVGQATTWPTDTFDSNIRGTWSVLEAARQLAVQRVIFASSDKAYGDLKGQSYDESHPLAGRFPYDVSKSCADLIAQSFAHSFGLHVAITRCGNFFGPGDLNLSRLIPGTIMSLLASKRPVVRSNGQFVRDYIYVADGAAAYRLLARQMVTQRLAGEPFNFSYGLKLTALDVIARIQKIMGTSLEPEILNEARNEIPVQCLEASKARTMLGWRPEYGFDEGLAKTIRWYRTNQSKL